MRAKEVICGILVIALIAGGCKKRYRDLTADLHRAAEAGDLGKVQVLIARGANVNARDDNSRTPLHAAIQEGHEDVAEVLVRCGAEMDIADKSGLTPMMAAMRQDRRAVVKCLSRTGATVDLHLAAYLGDADQVASLIRGGANVNARNSRGRTPLDEAVRRGHKEIVQFLTAKAKDTSAGVPDGGTKK